VSQNEVNQMLKQRLDYPGAGTSACLQGADPYNPTLRDKLLAQRERFTSQLANINSAIEALDKNPNFEKVVNILGKLNF
jgi:hypothetical protein